MSQWGLRLRRHLWVLLAYLILSLLLTWPLVVQFASHVPGDGIDDPALAWNLWWLKHALVDQPQNPFAATWVFWPVGINLAFYTLTILNGLLSIPLQTIFGVVPAYNSLLLSAFVLGGYGAFLLCRDCLPGLLGSAPAAPRPDQGAEEARRRGSGAEGSMAHVDQLSLLCDLGAFIGGALYAFASAKMFYAALGQGNIASSQWAPFAALYIVRAARPRGSWHDAILAALFLAAQAYAELTYASFLVLFAGLALVWRLAGDWYRLRRHNGGPSARPGSRWPGVLARFVLLAALFGLAIAPFLANMLPDLRAEGDFFSSGGGFADVFSADVAGYLLPTQLHPLFGGLTQQLAARWHMPIDKGQQIYLGYVALGLAILGLLRARQGRVPRPARGAAGAEPDTPRPSLASPSRSRKRPGDATWPGAWYWAVSAGLFFALTLGPSLRVAGRDLGLPLPFDLVAQLPFFKGNRYPSRYSVLLLLSLAPLVAAGATSVLLRLTARAPNVRGSRRATVLVAACAGLLVLLLFEHLSAPLPLFDLRIPQLYKQVARAPGDFALLELPPGWRNGARVLGKQDIVIMQELWDQTGHGKRLLGGNTSRNPEFKFQYFAEDPTLARLLAPTTAADVAQHGALAALLSARPISEAERARARQWADFLKIGYVMVHHDKLPAAAERALIDLLPVRLVGQEGPLALYAVEPGPAPERFALASEAGRLALGEGWSPPALPDASSAGASAAIIATAENSASVWAERPEARLLLPLPPEAAQIRLYGWSPIAGQRAALTVNGRAAGELPLAQAPGWLTYTVPADPGRPPLSDVRLHFAQTIPLDRLPAGTRVPGAAAGPWAGLLARSAGTETGDFAHLYVDGRDLSPNLRGYNLVALGPELPAVTDATQAEPPIWLAASFDTHLDKNASARLAEWIHALPAGTLVLGAVRDEGSLNLQPEAVQALQTLGVANDLRGHFRWGHAFIGAKGAAPGTAQEAFGALRPAQVSAGVPASSADVAAAFTTVEVQ